MATNAAQLAKTGKFGDLRRRLVFLLLALVVYRVGAHIPVPGIDPAQLQQVRQIAGNAAELHSALANLVGNAVRYTPAGGHIEIGWRTSEEGGGGEFWVRDDGIGIDPVHIPRLTERFYRVDRGRSRETGGTGLGLAIVKHILTRHQGELTVNSELGKGSRFAMRFPPVRVRRD